MSIRHNDGWIVDCVLVEFLWLTVCTSLTFCTQGCQIFLDTIYQKGGEYTKFATKVPNGNKMYQIVVKYSQWPKSIPTFPIPRLSKIFPNWIFGLKTYHLAALFVLENNKVKIAVVVIEIPFLQ
jgi:hypothetical protein